MIFPEYVLSMKDSNRFELVKETVIVGDSVFRKDIDVIAFNIVGGSYSGAYPLAFTSMSMFRNGHVYFPLNKSINYCGYCLVDSISEYGVGYFKKEWAAPNSNFCKYHGVYLNKVVVGNGESVTDKLMGVLLGKIDKSKKIDEGIVVINKPYVKLREYLPLSTNCLWREVVSFIQYFILRVFNKYDMSNVRDDYSYAYKMVSTPSGRLKFINYNTEVFLVEFMLDNFYVELLSFVEKNSSLISGERMMQDYSVINFKSLKLKSAKCDLCIEKSGECLNSLMIEHNSDKDHRFNDLSMSKLVFFNARKYKSRC